MKRGCSTPGLLGAIALLAAVAARPASAAAANPAALRVAVAVADVVRRDAAFELHDVSWQPTQGIQVVDFQPQFGRTPKGPAYARAEVSVAAAVEAHFGVAGAGRIQVRVDEAVVFERDFREPTRPVEYAYDRFRWPAAFDVPLAAGSHRVTVTVTAGPAGGRFFLQACDAQGAEDRRVRFGTEEADWRVASARLYEPGMPFTGPWLPVVRPPVADFTINPQAAFKKHSLIEWHYATGVTHLGLLLAADATGDAALRAHVDRLAQFTWEQMPALRRQFEEAYAWRGANYRLFRGSLLDDTSAPALPFIELVRRGELPAAEPLMEAILQFVRSRHPRLPDGTLCREEPEPQTVWADDLFMSTAFLVRAADWKNDPALWDEVLRQVRGFDRLLIDPVTGLYWHGYYAARRQPAAFHWGRANGWIAWALSECLQFMPADHPGRTDVLRLQRQHLAALLRYQTPSGLWRQLLDRPDAYEETSASAMFLLAMARGLKAGWLEPAVFAEPARRAWAGLQTRIDAQGVVHGICSGTAIGESAAFYLNRPQVDHDPRGVGAVIAAAVAAAELP